MKARPFLRRLDLRVFFLSLLPPGDYKSTEGGSVRSYVSHLAQQITALLSASRRSAATVQSVAKCLSGFRRFYPDPPGPLANSDAIPLIQCFSLNRSLCLRCWFNYLRLDGTTAQEVTECGESGHVIADHLDQDKDRHCHQRPRYTPKPSPKMTLKNTATVFSLSRAPSNSGVRNCPSSMVSS